MPAYGTAGSESTSRLPRMASLPALPKADPDLRGYGVFLDRAISDFYDTLAERLQFSIVLLGSASFGAAETTNAVSFGTDLEDADYTPLAIPSWNAVIWYTSLAVGGFTLNASAAPGGAGGTVKWVAIR